MIGGYPDRTFGRLIVTSTLQSSGAPLMDGASTRVEKWGDECHPSVCIRLPFTGHRPTRALVIGWRGWRWRPSSWRRRARAWLRWGNPWARWRWRRAVDRGKVIPGFSAASPTDGAREWPGYEAASGHEL